MILKLPGESLNKFVEHTSCPFCGTDNAERFRMSAEIVKCLDCGGVYLQKRLGENKLRELYQEFAISDPVLFPPMDQSGVLQSPLRRNYFMNELLEYIKPNGKLLDIGCAWGALLDNARSRGFIPLGNEIVTAYSDYAKQKLDIDVYTNDFLDSLYQENTFSAITMIHSLEHFGKPWEVVNKAFNLLKPQGIFCGIVPNIDSFASGVLEDEWEWIDPTFHLVYFSPDTLMLMLQSAGFIIEKIYTASGDFNPYLLSDIVKRLFRLKNPDEIEKRIELLGSEGKSEEIRFFVRKPGEPTQEAEDELEEDVTPDNVSDIPDDSSKIELCKASSSSNILNIELRLGDNISDIIYKVFNSGRATTKVIINDLDRILPDYANNWNGVEVKSPVFSQEDLESILSINEAMDSDEIANTELIEQEIIMAEPDAIYSYSGFSRQRASGKLSDVLPTPLFVNLGCGRDIREGFLNIDLFSDDERVIAMDIRKLGLPDSCAELVLASDILEHFSHRDTAGILQEWARILKPGKDMLIRCPSLKLQARTYMDGTWDADVASYMIFGGQTNDGDFHCNGFDEHSIKKHLEQAGLEVFEIDEEDLPQTGGYINLNMVVRARKKVELEQLQTEKKNEMTNPIVLNDMQSQSQTNTSDVATIPSGKPALNIVWEGSQLVWHSLALINREHCSNIIDTGLAELTIVPYEKEQFMPEGNAKYEKLLQHDVRFKTDRPEEISQLPYVWIRHQWPPKAEEPRGAKWIINQPWEFSTLRKDFVEIFQKADEIWTPSSFSRNCFINSGVDFNKVQVIPNGIDPHLFTPKGEKYLIPTEKKLKFLFVGGTIFRKGIDILIDAFAKTFTAKDNVMLFIKDMGGDSFYKGQTAKELIAKIRLIPNAPEIMHYEEYMSEEQMANLYRSCDVFISPYRGEGFSLPTLEAMACGLPVIVTKGGATDDFVDEEVGWLIESTRRSIGKEIDGHPLTGEAFVLEPNSDDLVQILKDIYENPAYLVATGLRASHRARTLWTWNRATVKIFARLDALYGTSLAKEAANTLKDKKDGISYLSEADDLFHIKSYEEAMLTFHKALATKDLPDTYRVHGLHRLAMISMAVGDFVMSEEYISKAELIKDIKVDAIYLRGKMFAMQGDWTSALEHYTEIFNNWKDYKFDSTLEVSLDALLCETADAFYHSEDMENALKLYTEALKLNSSNSYACLGSAKCFLTISAYQEARNMLEWAMKLNPDIEEAKELLEGIPEGE